MSRKSKMRIFHFYSNNKPLDCEHFSQPSLTDSSFYESLSDMVPRIIRGEVSGYSRSFEGYQYSVGDDPFEKDDLDEEYDLSDMDDLFSLDTLRRVEETKPTVGDSTAAVSAASAGEKVENAAATTSLDVS